MADENSSPPKIKLSFMCNKIALIGVCMYVTSVDNTNLAGIVISAFTGLILPYVIIGLILSCGLGINGRKLVCEMIEVINDMSEYLGALCIIYTVYKLYRLDTT